MHDIQEVSCVKQCKSLHWIFFMNCQRRWLGTTTNMQTKFILLFFLAEVSYFFSFGLNGWHFGHKCLPSSLTWQYGSWFWAILGHILTTCSCFDMNVYLSVLSRIEGENFKSFFPILWLFCFLLWVFYLLYVAWYVAHKANIRLWGEEEMKWV